MIREVMSKLDAAICGEIAILMFLGVFLAITIRTLFKPRKEISDIANLPLNDGSEIASQ